MANQWYMLTVVGRDRPGIVARLTKDLFTLGADLGEASMLRLGGNFTIMVMIKGDWDGETLHTKLTSTTADLNLHYHIDPIEAELHEHIQPNVRVHVYGANRPGIVSEVTAVLAELGLNILSLDTDIAGSEQSPLYIMQIEGTCDRDIADLEAALTDIRAHGIDVRIEPTMTLIG